MAKELKDLLENDVLSDEVKASLIESWNEKVQDLREEVAVEIRNEFATKYEKDKSELVEAMNAMVQDVLTSVIGELNVEKTAAVAEQVSYKKAVRENIKSFENFCQKIFEEELSEFREERKLVAENFTKIGDFVNKQTRIALESVHNEKRKLAEAKVELGIKSAKELNETKAKLIKEQAKLSSAFVQRVVTEELTQLKEELKEAKENNLGRKIFEAFANEYATSCFFEKKEVRKLVDAIKEREGKLEEAKKVIEAKNTKLNESLSEARMSKDKYDRTIVMNEILSTLSGEKRSIMAEMLEKHPTNKLNEQFGKYLPMIMEGKTATKSQSLNESSLKEMKGDRKNIVSESSNNTDNKIISEYIQSFQKLNNYK